MTISFQEGPSRCHVLAEALLDQARDDGALAAAIVMAAACVEAAEAFGDGDQADPAIELERRLARLRDVARRALATIVRREGAAA